MTDLAPPPGRARTAPIGLVFLAVTSIGWGLNWPVMKFVLTQWPPLSARGWTGIAGAAVLATIAAGRGERLRIPPGQFARLAMSAFFSVTLWMALMGLSLLWLPASEAAVIAYTMPVWAAVFGWLILGERMTWLRILALAMAFSGIVALMGGNGISASAAKLPGIAMALIGASGFALGAVLSKRFPVTMPLIASTAWQIGLGCAPVALAGLLIERPSLGALDGVGWSLMAYMVFVQFCIAYLCWFGALALLPAAVAAIGTMAVPVIGVVVSAIALGEPLGPGQIAALLFTLAGVVLATRS